MPAPSLPTVKQTFLMRYKSRMTSNACSLSTNCQTNVSHEIQVKNDIQCLFLLYQLSHKRFSWDTSQEWHPMLALSLPTVTQMFLMRYKSRMSCFSLNKYDKIIILLCNFSHVLVHWGVPISRSPIPVPTRGCQCLPSIRRPLSTPALAPSGHPVVPAVVPLRSYGSSAN